MSKIHSPVSGGAQQSRQTYLKLGVYDRAIGAFQKALTIAPDDPATNKNLSLAHYLHKA